MSDNSSPLSNGLCLLSFPCIQPILFYCSQFTPLCFLSLLRPRPFHVFDSPRLSLQPSVARLQGHCGCHPQPAFHPARRGSCAAAEILPKIQQPVLQRGSAASFPPGPSSSCSPTSWLPAVPSPLLSRVLSPCTAHVCSSPRQLFRPLNTGLTKLLPQGSMRAYPLPCPVHIRCTNVCSCSSGSIQRVPAFSAPQARRKFPVA